MLLFFVLFLIFIVICLKGLLLIRVIFIPRTLIYVRARVLGWWIIIASAQTKSHIFKSKLIKDNKGQPGITNTCQGEPAVRVLCENSFYAMWQLPGTIIARGKLLFKNTLAKSFLFQLLCLW